MTDWKEKQIDGLTEAAKESVQRTRYVFMLVNIAGLIILIAWFNSNFTLLRYSIYSEKIVTLCQKESMLEKRICKREYDNKDSDYDGVMKNDRKTRTEIYEKDLNVIQMPIVGVKIHAWDIDMLGGMSMTVLAIWYYYSSRREYRVMQDINRVIKTSAYKNARNYVRQTVKNYHVFNVTENDTNSFPLNFLHNCTILLIFIPFWIPIFVSVTNLGLSFVPLNLLSLEPDYKAAFEYWSFPMQVEIISRLIFVVFLSIFNLKICSEIKKFREQTKFLLEAI
jgi:hypothetical protein